MLKHLVQPKLAFAFALIATFYVTEARAQPNNYFWVNPAGGLYSEPSNWIWSDFQGNFFSGGPPLAHHQVSYFGGTYTVDVDIPVNNQADYFGANAVSDVTLDITELSGYTTGYVRVGSNTDNSSNNLTVTGSPFISGPVELSPGYTAQSSLTVSNSFQAPIITVGGINFYSGHLYQEHRGQGTLTLNPGANVTTNVLMAYDAGAGSSIVFNGGTLTILGDGRFNENATPQSFIKVGDGNHAAVLNLEYGEAEPAQFRGQFSFGYTETLTISQRATVNYNNPGGSLVAGDIHRDTTGAFPGAFNWVAGRIYLESGSVDFNAAGLFGSNLNLTSARDLFVSGNTNISSGASVTIAGGSLITSTLTNSGGSLAFTNGTLQVHQGDFTIGPTGDLNSSPMLTVGIGSSIQSGGTVIIESTQGVTIDGGNVYLGSLVSHGQVNVANGYLQVIDIDFPGGPGMSVGTGGIVYANTFERNTLVVDGGALTVNRDPENSSISEALNGSFIGGATHDSAMTVNDGLVYATNMKIGVTPGFVDTVTINGGRLTMQNLLAKGGAGSILIFNGGTINAGHSEVDGPSTFVVGNGTTDATFHLDYSGSTHTFADGLQLSASGHLTGEGTIFGNVTNGGKIGPGNSPGQIDIVGSLISSGVLDFEIESTESFDRLVLDGQFNAGGVIAITLLVDSPGIGDSFDLMDFASLIDSGYTFDFRNAALLAGRVWNTSAFATTGTISVVAGLAGDFNHDNFVDAADYIVWRKDPGHTPAQYELWRSHFGQPFGSGSGASASHTVVPEPATLALLIFAAAGWCLRRHRGA